MLSRGLFIFFVTNVVPFFVSVAPAASIDWADLDPTKIGKGSIDLSSVIIREFDLWGYTDSTQTTPRFDCENDGLHPLPYSGIENIGTTLQRKCSFSPFGAIVRQFHLQSIDSNGNQKNDVLYNVHTSDGSIGGNDLLKQTAIFFNSADGAGRVMNYGVSRLALPFPNQAYVYTGSNNSSWMRELTSKYPDVKIANLVLPGAHDAGMYKINRQEDAIQAADKHCRALWDKTGFIGQLLASQYSRLELPRQRKVLRL